MIDWATDTKSGTFKAKGDCDEGEYDMLKADNFVSTAKDPHLNYGCALNSGVCFIDASSCLPSALRKTL